MPDFYVAVDCEVEPETELGPVWSEVSPGFLFPGPSWGGLADVGSRRWRRHCEVFNTGQSEKKRVVIRASILIKRQL